VARAEVIRITEPTIYEEIVGQIATQLAGKLNLSAETLKHEFLDGTLHSAVSVSHGAALPYCQIDGIDQQEMVMVHCQSGVCIDVEKNGSPLDTSEPVYAFFFLVSPSDDQSNHLRTLATLANRIDENGFTTEWRAAADEKAMKESLLHHERYITFSLLSDTKTEDFIDRRIRDLNLPAGVLVALVRRNDQVTIPNGDSTLQEGDQMTVIGNPAGIERLYELYRGGANDESIVQ
jgi:mannitol/fructose-specific phosphotransferase system IIA component (Ntr-type)